MNIKTIIPLLTLTNWSGFTNQPNGDSVEIVSDSASDVGFCTIWGVDTKNVLRYETVSLNGTTVVTTSRADWKNIYGVLLGKANGNTITRAVGTITIREGSGNLTITTISATYFHSGMILLDIPGHCYEYEIFSGLSYRSTLVRVASSNEGIKEIGVTCVKDKCGKNPLSIISDNTGASIQITVYEI